MDMLKEKGAKTVADIDQLAADEETKKKNTKTKNISCNNTCKKTM